MRVTWNKRYITLAPVATLLGLAFRVYDPDHLLGEQEEIGMTLALVPTETPGVQIGRRHYPAGQAFQNGPTQGKDVFIPFDWVIGGQARLGQGWRMLMDCLAAGRAISLPALGTGACLFSARYAAAYARIRRQFGLSIGRFEGIQEPLARIAGYAYSLEAARRLTSASLDAGEQPSVLSAILKYHATERMRTALNDALDIHGGRGICDGPRNYLFGTYQSVPIAITVEGANILTRNLIIFGQGALRCHPHLLREMEAAQLPDPQAAMTAFDKELWRHIRDATSNVIRSFWHNLTFGIFVSTPDPPGIGSMYSQLHMASVTFAAVADLVMGTLGGEMKRRESLSARLGDALSELYIMSCVLKRFEDDGSPPADLPLVEWNHQMAMYNVQKALDEVLQNLPAQGIAFLLRAMAFPWGRYRRPPDFRVVHACATLAMAPGDTRERLTKGIFISRDATDATGRMEAAFAASVERDAIEEKIRKAGKTGRKGAMDLPSLVRDGVITEAEADTLKWASGIIRDAIDVDDFASEELTGKSGARIRSVAAE
jgi:acyl-CoA dehydrogenase